MNLSKRFFIFLIGTLSVFSLVIFLFQYSENEKRFGELLHARLQVAACEYYYIGKSNVAGRSETANYASYKNENNGYEKAIFIEVDTAYNMVQHSAATEVEVEKSADAVKQTIENIDKDSGYSVFRNPMSHTGWSICSFHRFANSYVAVVAPYSTQLKDILLITLPFFITLLVMSLVISVMGYMLSRTMRNNIYRIRSLVDKANSGEKVGVDSNIYVGELGKLYTQLNELYNSMQQRVEQSEREKKMALLDVEEKNKMKRELTNNINHELKTPVAGISGYIETLLNNPDLDKGMRISFLEKCFAQTERLSSLLRDVTTISRLDEIGMTARDKEFVDVGAIMQNIISDIAADTTMHPVEQRIRINANFSSPTYIYGSPSLIQSIFQNLTNNSVAYSGGQDIFVRIIAENEHFYTFTFADNGVGVEEKHLPHLFERFYRADEGRSRKLGGTGLGLAIVKNAVTHHGGTIKVERGEYGGLLFTFTLPKRKPIGKNA